MPIVPVADLADARLADYRSVPDARLLQDRGLFVAEGRLVVRRLLSTPAFRTRSLLVTEQALRGLADVLDTVGGPDVFLCSLDQLREIAGFNIHRGCLAIGERPAAIPLDEVVRGARIVVALDGVGNADNVGGVFRNAAAFGGDAVVLSPGCCDPLYRKAIRTSMGAALRVPFARADPWPAALHRLRALGFTVVACSPDESAADLDTLAPGTDARLAFLFGAEGAGLSPEARSLASHLVRIPMTPGIDSLNVAVASGIVLYRFRQVEG